MDPGDTVHGRLDQRMAKGRDFDALDGTRGDGRTCCGRASPRSSTASTARPLAVLGDFVPMGVGQALGIRGGGNSLDNTLRLVKLVPTEWVLLDIHVHAVERGFGHGLVHMFAEDGTLLATASQSCIVRYWRGPEEDRDPGLIAGELGAVPDAAVGTDAPRTPDWQRIAPRRLRAAGAQGIAVGGPWGRGPPDRLQRAR